MDMMERRIREVVASLLSRGAKALERTAGELEHAASELRNQREREEAERAWAEEPRPAPDTMIRGAPLRAVPDTPTDEAKHGEAAGNVVSPSAWTPPDEAPQTPDAPREGAVDARVTTSTEVAGRQEPEASARVVAIAEGTVTSARARLGELSAAELQQLREVEAATRNRTTLLAAIDRALESAR